MSKIISATVVEQTPHPLLGPAPFVLIMFNDPAYRDMNRRRIKREHNRALKKWRRSRKLRAVQLLIPGPLS